MSPRRVSVGNLAGPDLTSSSNRLNASEVCREHLLRDPQHSTPMKKHNESDSPFKDTTTGHSQSIHFASQIPRYNPKYETHQGSQQRTPTPSSSINPVDQPRKRSESFPVPSGLPIPVMGNNQHHNSHRLPAPVNSPRGRSNSTSSYMTSCSLASARSGTSDTSPGVLGVAERTMMSDRRGAVLLEWTDPFVSEPLSPVEENAPNPIAISNMGSTPRSTTFGTTHTPLPHVLELGPRRVSPSLEVQSQLLNNPSPQSSLSRSPCTSSSVTKFQSQTTLSSQPLGVSSSTTLTPGRPLGNQLTTLPGGSQQSTPSPNTSDTTTGQNSEGRVKVKRKRVPTPRFYKPPMGLEEVPPVPNLPEIPPFARLPSGSSTRTVASNTSNSSVQIRGAATTEARQEPPSPSHSQASTLNPFLSSPESHRDAERETESSVLMKKMVMVGSGSSVGSTMQQGPCKVLDDSASDSSSQFPAETPKLSSIQGSFVPTIGDQTTQETDPTHIPFTPARPPKSSKRIISQPKIPTQQLPNPVLSSIKQSHKLWPMPSPAETNSTPDMESPPCEILETPQTIENLSSPIPQIQLTSPGRTTQSFTPKYDINPVTGAKEHRKYPSRLREPDFQNTPQVHPIHSLWSPEDSENLTQFPETHDTPVKMATTTTGNSPKVKFSPGSLAATPSPPMKLLPTTTLISAGAAPPGVPTSHSIRSLDTLIENHTWRERAQLSSLTGRLFPGTPTQMAPKLKALPSPPTGIEPMTEFSEKKEMHLSRAPTPPISLPQSSSTSSSLGRQGKMGTFGSVFTKATNKVFQSLRVRLTPKTTESTSSKGKGKERAVDNLDSRWDEDSTEGVLVGPSDYCGSLSTVLDRPAAFHRSPLPQEFRSDSPLSWTKIQAPSVMSNESQKPVQGPSQGSIRMAEGSGTDHMVRKSSPRPIPIPVGFSTERDVFSPTSSLMQIPSLDSSTGQQRWDTSRTRFGLLKGQRSSQDVIPTIPREQSVNVAMGNGDVSNEVESAKSSSSAYSVRSSSNLSDQSMRHMTCGQILPRPDDTEPISEGHPYSNISDLLNNLPSADSHSSLSSLMAEIAPGEKTRRADANSIDQYYDGPSRGTREEEGDVSIDTIRQPSPNDREEAQGNLCIGQPTSNEVRQRERPAVLRARPLGGVQPGRSARRRSGIDSQGNPFSYFSVWTPDRPAEESGSDETSGSPTEEQQETLLPYLHGESVEGNRDDEVGFGSNSSPLRTSSNRGDPCVRQAVCSTVPHQPMEIAIQQASDNTRGPQIPERIVSEQRDTPSHATSPTERQAAHTDTGPNEGGLSPKSQAPDQLRHNQPNPPIGDRVRYRTSSPASTLAPFHFDDDDYSSGGPTSPSSSHVGIVDRASDPNAIVANSSLPSEYGPLHRPSSRFDYHGPITMGPRSHFHSPMRHAVNTAPRMLGPVSLPQMSDHHPASHEANVPIVTEWNHMTQPWGHNHPYGHNPTSHHVMPDMSNYDPSSHGMEYTETSNYDPSYQMGPSDIPYHAISHGNYDHSRYSVAPQQLEAYGTGLGIDIPFPTIPPPGSLLQPQHWPIPSPLTPLPPPSPDIVNWYQTPILDHNEPRLSFPIPNIPSYPFPPASSRNYNSQAPSMISHEEARAFHDTRSHHPIYSHVPHEATSTSSLTPYQSLQSNPTPSTRSVSRSDVGDSSEVRMVEKRNTNQIERPQSRYKSRSFSGRPPIRTQSPMLAHVSAEDVTLHSSPPHSRREETDAEHQEIMEGREDKEERNKMGIREMNYDTERYSMDAASMLGHTGLSPPLQESMKVPFVERPNSPRRTGLERFRSKMKLLRKDRGMV
ncbi:hypothetical protein M231_04307 [Tremella mesenterica]|uniref:Uncharacterized protein n=1 Tax=Tremella mesenterica TaxID=5217 RepID=A0A4Q1BKV5_TREME|nr:hypothetical protein M231_04307 [Tremella mesenterica]